VADRLLVIEAVLLAQLLVVGDEVGLLGVAEGAAVSAGGQVLERAQVVGLGVGAGFFQPAERRIERREGLLVGVEGHLLAARLGVGQVGLFQLRDGGGGGDLLGVGLAAGLAALTALAQVKLNVGAHSGVGDEVQVGPHGVELALARVVEDQ